jgi:hypothetical protein
MTKETGTAKTLGRNRQGIWLTKLRHIFDKLFEANNVFSGTTMADDVA